MFNWATVHFPSVDLSTYLEEVGWGDMDWIGLAQDRNRWRALVNSVLNLRVPWNAGKLLSGLTSSGLSSRVELVTYVRLLATKSLHLSLFSQGALTSCFHVLPFRYFPLGFMFGIVFLLQFFLRYSARQTKENKLLDLSPRANYTDRATAACRRS
jgi:hypothetical protein